MRQAFTCCARRPGAVAAQLPLAAQDACYPLLFGCVIVRRILAVGSSGRLPAAVGPWSLLGQVVEVAFFRRLGIWRGHLCARSIYVVA